jgi:hypothetical protein
MSAEQTNCKSCGRPIRQQTADKTGGICRICERDARYGPPRRWVPPPRLSDADLTDLIITNQPDSVIDYLFEVAVGKMVENKELTAGDIVVYTVWTFLGETCNGGFMQYLTNDSGEYAHLCGASLRAIGTERYATIIEACIREFTAAASPRDPQWKADLDAYWDANPHDPFKDVESRFWGLYSADKEELTNLLFTYIREHREEFALPFSA